MHGIVNVEQYLYSKSKCIVSYCHLILSYIRECSITTQRNMQYNAISSENNLINKFDLYTEMWISLL